MRLMAYSEGVGASRERATLLAAGAGWKIVSAAYMASRSRANVRAQQIRGIAQVVMVLRPTFSIDYIRVVMNLE